MPELDTYHTIERYARNPDDLDSVQAFRFLQRRTLNKIVWEAMNNMRISDLDASSDLYMGALHHHKKVGGITATDLAKMSKVERDAMYIQMCESAGVHIDPQALMNPNKQAED